MRTCVEVQIPVMYWVREPQAGFPLRSLHPFPSISSIFTSHTVQTHAWGWVWTWCFPSIIVEWWLGVRKRKADSWRQRGMGRREKPEGRMKKKEGEKYLCFSCCLIPVADCSFAAWIIRVCTCRPIVHLSFLPPETNSKTKAMDRYYSISELFFFSSSALDARFLLILRDSFFFFYLRFTCCSSQTISSSSRTSLLFFLLVFFLPSLSISDFSPSMWTS